MFSSIGLSLVFTVAFVVAGGYALVRFAVITANGGGDRLAELSHLLMSVAMIAMTWGAGVGELARALQVATFAGFGTWFLARAARPARGIGHGRIPNADHAVTAAAMVWMGRGHAVDHGHVGGGHVGRPRSRACR